jgi:1-acyl-sn-glycerol-3-phosphate acyltransferase
MSAGYTVPIHNQAIRWLFRPLFRLLFHLLSPVKITGRTNVPKHGGYLIAINHVSTYDPPFAVAFWPVAPEVVGAVEIWTRPGQAQLAHLYGGIQVHRGEYDRRLLDTMIAALRAGRPLLIAPEGGRSHKPGLRRGYPGIAYVAGKADVPVVPVGVIGTTRDYFTRASRGERPPLEMRIGQPLRLPPVPGHGAERRAALQENTDLLMRHLAALLPPEYHGIYAADAPNEPV